MSETQILMTDTVDRKQDIAAHIERIGVLPTLRVNWAADAIFVADALAEAGVPIVEVNVASSGAFDLLAQLLRHASGMIVGAGSVFTADAARRCLDLGASFLSSDIFAPLVVNLAARENVAVIPGALTPTEVMSAWTAGADFVKVGPCDASGGYAYIRSLNAMMPNVRLIAAGGVNQLTVLDFIRAGASAVNAGTELVPSDAVSLRQSNRIKEMARRFRNAVVAGREEASNFEGVRPS